VLQFVRRRVDKFLQPLVAEMVRERDGDEKKTDSAETIIILLLYVSVSHYVLIPNHIRTYIILHVYSTPLCTHIVHNIQYVYTEVVNNKLSFIYHHSGINIIIIINDSNV